MKKASPKAGSKAKSRPAQADIRADVIIVGGGLAGLSLAGVLGQAGIDCLLVDREDPVKQQQAPYDGRTTAVSFASHRVLQAAGVWDDLLPDCEPILDIRVADGASPLFLHFSAREETPDADNVAPFGWIVENRIMRRALAENAVRLSAHVRSFAPATVTEFFSDAATAGVVLDTGQRLSAPLLIGADGRHSATRAFLGIGTKGWSYGQTAIVCNVAHERDHENVALEHFLPAGPFAALPMTRGEDGAHRSSVVWTVHGEDVEKYIGLPPADFDAALQGLFGPHLGAVQHVSAPMAYPLQLMHADSYIGPRMALMAEAAHVIHPIAGQGLNLSMRDIAVLAELVFDGLKRGQDIGAASLLKSYEQWRRTDTLLMAGFTDVLNRLFSNKRVTAALARDIGIGIIEKIDPLKGFFARQAMGLGGTAPRIVRQGRL